MKNLMTINLWAGHSLIAGTVPIDKVPLADFNPLNHKPKIDLESFGLFDSSSPNYTTYYPEVNQEDLKPKAEEFIYPVFRLLSNVVVNRMSYNPVEFPADVLKKSMKLLVGQAVYPDHEQQTGNAVGTVKEVFWQDAYKVGNQEIPGGINGVLMIDGKSNPRLARGIMMDPPSIHSNSVTVTFTWKKSHPDMSDSDFRDKLGEFDSKGELVRRIADKVVAYHETSLVPHGADPYAKKLDAEGNIVLPKYAAVRDGQFSADNSYEAQRIVFDYKDVETEEDTVKVSLSSSTLVELYNTNNNKPKNTINMDLLTYLNTQLGTTATAENFQEVIGTKLASLIGSEAKVTELTGKLTEAEGKVTTLTDEKTALELRATTAEGANLTAMITEAENQYKLAFGDKADTAIVEGIQKADLAAATAFKNQYAALVEEKLPLTCNDCHSTNVSRQSSVAKPSGEENKSTFDRPRKSVYSSEA